MSSETSLENSHIVKLETDPSTGELILPLSDDMIESLGWEIGDTIEWVDNHDGSWTIRLKKKSLLTRLRKYYTILCNKFARSKDE